MKDRELLKIFIRNAWELRCIKGSPHHLFKDGKRKTIAVHDKEINPNLANKIMDRCELK